MTPSEASRQYQLAVEHERRAHRFFDDVLSGQDELEQAITERTASRESLLDAMVAAAKGQS